MKIFEANLIDEPATVAFGNKIARCVSEKLKQGVTIFLNGDLGAGKTTLSRGFIQGMGHVGNVKSPTYTIVEPYELKDWTVYHFDLYRLADPEELEFLGIRDYFSPNTCNLIEWPEKAHGHLAKADIDIYMHYQGEQRRIELKAMSALGEQLIEFLA